MQTLGSIQFLASGVAKARSLAVEPIPTTFNHLKHNIQINDLEPFVNEINLGVGETEKRLKFTTDYDVINHVILDPMPETDFVEIAVKTLDTLFKTEASVLLKIDVEGFEMNVLRGGHDVAVFGVKTNYYRIK